jgi:hypothetical protein
MPQSLEERVAYLEGKVEEQTRGFGDLIARINAMSARIDALDQKIDRFRAELCSRIDALDQKVERFRGELAARIDALDARFDSVEDKMSRQFIWLAGIQIAVMLAVIGALLRQ